MKKKWIIVFVLLLTAAKAAWLDVDFSWEINAPEAWERKTAGTGSVRTFSYFPDLNDRVDSSKAFFYDPTASESKDESPVGKTRGISIMFGPESADAITAEADESMIVKLQLFGKEQKAWRFEHETKKGIRYQYVIIANVHAFPDEAFGETDPVIMSFICSSAEEFSEYKKILETLRRKVRPKDIAPI